MPNEHYMVITQLILGAAIHDIPITDEICKFCILVKVVFLYIECILHTKQLSLLTGYLGHENFKTEILWRCISKNWWLSCQSRQSYFNNGNQCRASHFGSTFQVMTGVKEICYLKTIYFYQLIILLLGKELQLQPDPVNLNIL